MTSIAARTAPTTTATPRLLLGVAAAAVLLAAVVATAIALLLSPGPSVAGSSGTSTGDAATSVERLPGQSVPTDDDVLSPTERACQLARVAGC